MSLDVTLLDADRVLYDANITHNLVPMAREAGLYTVMWHPEELSAYPIKARDLIAPLNTGLELLRMAPEHFEQFNATNGWGMYKHFVPFVEKYLQACLENPDAMVEVSR